MGQGRTYLIAGNWKMNLALEASERLAGKLDKRVGRQQSVEVMVAPSYIALARVSNILRWSKIGVAAQDMSESESGAFTGDITAEMLLTVGCAGVILGHSERRAIHSESDELIGKKLERALSAGLVPIVCVGETASEREAGDTFDVLTRQLAGAFPESVAKKIASGKGFVLAYEPVWAIGTGKVATPEIAQEAHAFIRAKLADQLGASLADQTRILYGGSVKPDNAAELLEQGDIDGALVGGASLKADEFVKIIQAAPGFRVDEAQTGETIVSKA